MKIKPNTLLYCKTEECEGVTIKSKARWLVKIGWVNKKGISRHGAIAFDEGMGLDDLVPRLRGIANAIEREAGPGPAGQDKTRQAGHAR